MAIKGADSAALSLQEKLRRRKDSGLYRCLPEALSSGSIDFWSNDYLGLVKQDVGVVSNKLGGSTGSRLISGNSNLANDVESQVADFHGFDAAVLMSSGYVANLGLLACIAGRKDVVLHDELAHASLIDGALLSPAKRLHFKHNNVEDLASKLANLDAENVFVAVESLYSMDGDFAPLKEIANVCNDFKAALVVDEAHSVGVVGSRGEGLVSSLGMQRDVLACVYTYGKAPGVHGGLVAGDSWLKEYLINFCRPFIYSTAPTEHSLKSLQQSYELFSKASQARSDLHNIVEFFRAEVHKLQGWNFLSSESQIQGVLVDGNDQARRLEAHLRNNGLAAKAVLSPTVPAGFERIRICLHSFNTKEDIGKLTDCIRGFDL